MHPATIPIILGLFAFSSSLSFPQSVSEQLQQLQARDEAKISEYINGPSAPAILPQITIHSDPYKVPTRPFPASPIAPQYILNPYTGTFEQIR